MKGRTKIRSTMPPLKRAVTASKKKVIFFRGPWHDRTALISVDLDSTGIISIGEQKGEYQYSGIVRGLGRKKGAPFYIQFNWFPAPLAELDRALKARYD